MYSMPISAADVDFYFFGVPRDVEADSRVSRGDVFQEWVPIGYVELLTRDGVMEVGFNLYLRVSRERDGVAVCAAAEDLSRAAGREEFLDRSVSDRA
jgi:hypothetical protein